MSFIFLSFSEDFFLKVSINFISPPFLNKFSTHTHAHTHIKNVQIVLTEDALSSFELVKKELSSISSLAHPVLDAPLS